MFLLTKKIRRFFVKYLTKNPFLVKSFQDLYKEPIGQQVDYPESLSAILKLSIDTYTYYPEPKILNYNISFERDCLQKRRFKKSGLFKSPDRYVYSISNGCITGKIGLIYDMEKRAFINESAKEWLINLNYLSYLSAFSLPQKKKIDGITFSLLSNGADGSFYHFLFESLIKLAMYDGMLNFATNFLVNGPATDWKLKWLSRTNLDISKIIWVDNLDHFECDQLIFTNKIIEDQQINSWSINNIKTLTSTHYYDKTNAKKNILWLSRRTAYTRNILWEDLILSTFPEIEDIDLNELSIEETLEKLKKASHIIAPHGAGLSNIFLANPGTKILELFPTGAFFKPCYSRLAYICNLEHQALFINFTDQNDTEFGLKLFIKSFTEFK